jgi:hypothetical protein
LAAAFLQPQQAPAAAATAAAAAAAVTALSYGKAPQASTARRCCKQQH